MEAGILSENDISYAIRGAAFEVFKELGPGLFESVYEVALEHVLLEKGLSVKRQLPIPVIFRDKKLDAGFKLDLLVADKVIVEIKSIEALQDVHKKQLLTYLRLTKLKLGILINFNCKELKDKESIIRIANNL